MTDYVKDVIEDGSRLRSEGEHRISRQPELHEALQVCPTELIYLPDQITLSSKKVLGKSNTRCDVKEWPDKVNTIRDQCS